VSNGEVRRRKERKINEERRQRTQKGENKNKELVGEIKG